MTKEEQKRADDNRANRKRVFIVWVCRVLAEIFNPSLMDMRRATSLRVVDQGENIDGVSRT